MNQSQLMKLITYQSTNQPIQVTNAGWMSVPTGLGNCPPGLEYLSLIDQLLVNQKVELLEVFLGFETNNKYIIKNSIGQNVYFAAEDTDLFTRNCCGGSRPFEMRIFDSFQNELLLFSILRHGVEVTSPPGTVIGTVEQEWTIFRASFVIKDATGEVVLRVLGPYCTFSLYRDVDYNVYSRDGETWVGKITKHWSGLAREWFTDADYFGISFPMDLDVRIKAVLLGACFLIDFLFFERRGRH